MTRVVGAALAALFVAFWLTGAALAQTETKRSPLGLPMPPSAEKSIGTGAPVDPPGIAASAWNWVLGVQQKLNRDMAAAVKDLKAAGGLHAAWVLAFVSFVYGVLHAAGPGHGKAVISSYVLANERTVRRGILLSFLAAFFQALSAVAIVGVLAIALNATSLTIKSTEHWIETVSWAFVAAVGAWMLYGQVKKLTATRAAIAQHAHCDAHTCCGHHDHSHDHAAHKGNDYADPQTHAHEHGDCCGHAQLPAPKDFEGNLTWSKALAIAASVGIRPCTGAILVLIFALSQGLLWAGVFATFAMALGTAITTSTLAALAVGSKEMAARYAGEGSRWAGYIGTAAGLAGSSAVLVMGAAFFFASLNGPGPL